MRPTRVLFVAEDVTLAQVVRLAALGSALDSARYDVHFATSRFDELVFRGTRFPQHTLKTLAPEIAERQLESGGRLYEKGTLLEYIADELALYERVKPDVVIGDFRLSLSTSAQLWGVPCAVLINAYWSPFAVRERWPIPDHPLIRLLGEARVAEYFPKAIPHVFAHFAAPLNAARKRHGLKPVGSLLEMLTHGDYTLYPDEPSLVPTRDLPASHRFLGPIVWEPNAALPPLEFAEPERPLVYVTLGSSGRIQLLPLVLDSARSLPCNFVLATAGRTTLTGVPPNVKVFDWVPGSQLAGRAALVVSNGGSTTGYQALLQGTPVLGVPTNFDQHLATQAIVAAGAGASIPARSLSVPGFCNALMGALHTPTLKLNAERISKDFAALDAHRSFQDWILEVTGGNRSELKARSNAL